MPRPCAVETHVGLVLCALRFVLCLIGDAMLTFTLTRGKVKEQSTKFKAQSTKRS